MPETVCEVVYFLVSPSPPSKSTTAIPAPLIRGLKGSGVAFNDFGPFEACVPCAVADGDEDGCLSCESGGISRALTRAATSDGELGLQETFPQAHTMASFPPAVHDLLQIDALLSPEERRTRYAVRAFMVRAHPPRHCHWHGHLGPRSPCVCSIDQARGAGPGGARCVHRAAVHALLPLQAPISASLLRGA